MKRLNTVLEVLGLVAVTVGVGLLSIAAALIVGGVLAVLYANYGEVA